VKPPPFQYHDPSDLDEAFQLLANLENAKVLAGGQSLMPMLNMRLVFPDHVVDLNRVKDLSFLREAEGEIQIGAMTRQRDLERSELIRARCPLMSEALLQIGHRQTRNRGTIGGSLCHLDPAAELPAVAMALEATVHAQSVRGTRAIPMAEFPVFYMTPAIEPDEIVTSIEFEPWPAGHGYAFVEYARRHGDFAMVASAVLVELSSDGAIRRASIVIGGAGTGPIRCGEVEAALIGTRGESEVHQRATEVCREIDAMEDVHASKAYRRHLAQVLTARALDKAYARASASATT
jgi:carbon-monoxide dehydrogenase medium subunit